MKSRCRRGLRKIPRPDSISSISLRVALESNSFHHCPSFCRQSLSLPATVGSKCPMLLGLGVSESIYFHRQCYRLVFFLMDPWFEACVSLNGDRRATFTRTTRCLTAWMARTEIRCRGCQRCVGRVPATDPRQMASLRARDRLLFSPKETIAPNPKP